MSDFLSSMTGGLIGAAGACAAVWALFRELVLKKVDQHLQALSGVTAAQLELYKQAARAMQDHELSVYPALSELLYRAKVGSDSIRRAKSYGDLLSADVHEVCRELTTKLLSYRIYLSPEVFREVHEYKRILQDLVTIIDLNTRPETLSSLDALIDEKVRVQLENLCSRIEQLCGTLIPALRSRMLHLAGEDTHPR